MLGNSCMFTTLFRRVVPASTAIAACYAMAVAQAAPMPHKVLDLRTMSDPSGEFELSLCSRPSPSGNVPGHAFVMYSMQPHGSNRKVLALGYTTSAGAAKAALSYSGWLPAADGYLGEERYTSSKERCLVAKVDKKVFDFAWALAHPLASIPALADLRFSGDYRLGDKDCMEFMIKVAKLLPGVHVPERGATELPQPFMRRVIDAN